MRLTLAAAAAAVLLCAGRAASAGPEVDPLARPTTRLAAGFRVWLHVSVRGVDERDLCSTVALDQAGRLPLTLGGHALAPIPLAGLTATEARARVADAIARYYVEKPEVQLTIARMPRIQVIVEGSTYKTGVLTVLAGSRLSDALAETGYYPAADLRAVRIARTGADGTRSTLTVDFARALQEEGDARLDPVLQQADRITVPLTAGMPEPRFVAVFGEVGKPGYHPYQPGMAVRDALQAAGGLLPTADPDNVSLMRTRDRTYSVVNAGNALQGVTTDNLDLRADDVLTVRKRDASQRYTVMGEVVQPSTFDFKGTVTLKKALEAAGGLRPSADRSQVVILRGMLLDPARSQPVTVDYSRIARGEQPDVPLDPGDVVQVQRRRRVPSPLLDLGLTLLRLLVL